MDKKIKSLLSLSQKAGFVVSGEDNCVNALRTGDALLTIISTDASDNTKKKFLNKSKFYGVDCFVYGEKEDISSAIGKNRTTIIIINENFASKIKAILKNENLE